MSSLSEKISASNLSGQNLLNNQYLNKGSAFSFEERTQYNLHGFLPPQVETLQQQADRVWYQLNHSDNPEVESVSNIQKYKILQDVQDDNETLFFKVLLDHLSDLAPIVYTPTIGQVCQEFSKNYKRPRGLWLTPAHKGSIYEILKSLNRDIKLIVVTDNQRILGLGDLGAGGIGIPIGKLNLYTAGAGIQPEECLPISIDVGCGKEHILNSEHYFGVKENRLAGPEYDALIEEFITAVFKLWPDCLLQWEDFWKNNAIDILDRYKERYLSFNDDIQGTASVGVAGVLAAYKHLGKDLSTAKIVMLGGGAAGTGIMSLLETALTEAGNSSAKDNLLVLDSKGLISTARPNGFGNDSFKAKFAKDEAFVENLFGSELKNSNIPLETVIEIFKPDVLIGTSGVPGTFTETAIRIMAENCEQPIIMPFSNPTSQCEAIPADIAKWTNEKAIIATGSPFGPLTLSTGEIQTIGQGNNVFVFPGIGLGALFAKASKISDNVLYAAAKACADSVTEDDLKQRSVYPKVSNLRNVTLKVAAEVVRQVVKDGDNKEKVDLENLEENLRKSMWEPTYWE